MLADVDAARAVFGAELHENLWRTTAGDAIRISRDRRRRW